MASKPTTEVEHLDTEIEHISQLIQDATIPYKSDKVKTQSDKVKSQSRSKGKGGGGARKKLEIAADIKTDFDLEKLKGENLQKQIELTKLQLVLAKVQEQGERKGNVSSLLCSSTPKPNVGQKMEDFINVPTLTRLRSTAQAQSSKGTFLPSAYMFSTAYDKLDISEFVCGFLEIIKTTSQESLRSCLIEYLYLIMEKAIHYQ